METFSALLAICAGIGDPPPPPPPPWWFLWSVPEQTVDWWFGTPSRPLWRHDVTVMVMGGRDWWVSPGRLCFFYGAHTIVFRAESRLAPSQWETSLQSNGVSHWLDANPESVLVLHVTTCPQWFLRWRLPTWNRWWWWRTPGRPSTRRNTPDWTESGKLFSHNHISRTATLYASPAIIVLCLRGIGRYGWENINGLVKERRNSIANTLELRLSCSNPSISTHQCKETNFEPTPRFRSFRNRIVV